MKTIVQRYFALRREGLMKPYECWQLACMGF